MPCSLQPSTSSITASTVKQPLYTAGKVGTALRLASVEAEGALADVDRAEQDLALEVVKAYYGLLWAERDRELVAATQDQRKLHAEMARTRFKNGVATEVDVLRSEVAVANGAPELVRADNAIRQARALLNFYMVRPIDFPTRTSANFPRSPGKNRASTPCFRKPLAAGPSCTVCALRSRAPRRCFNWPKRRTACAWMPPRGTASSPGRRRTCSTRCIAAGASA